MLSILNGETLGELRRRVGSSDIQFSPGLSFPLSPSPLTSSPNQVRKSDRLANATDEERKEEERRKITSLTNSPE